MYITELCMFGNFKKIPQTVNKRIKWQKHKTINSNQDLWKEKSSKRDQAEQQYLNSLSFGCQEIETAKKNFTSEKKPDKQLVKQPRKT